MLGLPWGPSWGMPLDRREGCPSVGLRAPVYADAASRGAEASRRVLKSSGAKKKTTHEKKSLVADNGDARASVPVAVPALTSRACEHLAPTRSRLEDEIL